MLDSLLASFGGRQEAELLADLVLMTSLAKGRITQKEYDRIARALVEYPELSGLNWDWILARVEELAEDAPLFSDTRSTLEAKLTTPEKRRFGISLAAKIVGAGRPLHEEETAILHSLAEAFGIDEKEQDQLIKPLETDDLELSQGYFRSHFNDPAQPFAPSFAAALGAAEDPTQKQLLLFKLRAAHKVTETILPGTTVHSLGERLRFGPYTFRPDVVLSSDTLRYLVRILGPNEALYSLEHGIIATLVGRLQLRAQLVIVHQDQLSPADASFFQGFDPERLKVLSLREEN